MKIFAIIPLFPFVLAPSNSGRKVKYHQTFLENYMHCRNIALQKCKLYLVVGGMSAAVQAYVDTNDLKNSKKQGELDFVIAHNGKVIPIEVKSGKDYERHNALTNVLTNDDYNIDFAYILTTDNLRVDDKRIYMPIYMLMFIQKSPAPANQIFKFDLRSI